MMKDKLLKYIFLLSWYNSKMGCLNEKNSSVLSYSKEVVPTITHALSQRNISWPTTVLEICPIISNSFSVSGCYFPSGYQFLFGENKKIG